jgi:ribulose-phosphate 3-epimerase
MNGMNYFYRMNVIVAPSILSADFGNLEREVEMLNTSEADWIHCDVMDGRFVPNISFGIPVIKSVKKYAQKPLDVHLMIVEPEKYIDDFAKAGASILTVHYEACTHLHRIIHAIKEKNMMAGVAINPHTPVSLLEDVISDLDLVNMMSVNPGFGGQKFIPNTYNKIRQLRQLAQKHNVRIFIEVDGGVDVENAGELASTGANVLVAGNSVFTSQSPKQTISQLKHPSMHTSLT